MQTEIKCNMGSVDAEVVNNFRSLGAWGISTCVDLKGCNPDTIRDKMKIEQFVIELSDLIGMKRFGPPQIMHFGEEERVAGFSMTQLIETSLISGHFVNLTNAAYIDIFSCKEYDPSVAADFCRRFFRAESAKISSTIRR